MNHIHLPLTPSLIITNVKSLFRLLILNSYLRMFVQHVTKLLLRNLLVFKVVALIITRPPSREI